LPGGAPTAHPPSAVPRLRSRRSRQSRPHPIVRERAPLEKLEVVAPLTNGLPNPGNTTTVQLTENRVDRTGRPPARAGQSATAGTRASRDAREARSRATAPHTAART